MPARSGWSRLRDAHTSAGIRARGEVGAHAQPRCLASMLAALRRRGGRWLHLQSLQPPTSHTAPCLTPGSPGKPYSVTERNDEQEKSANPSHAGFNRLIASLLVGIEYAIVISVLIVGGIVLVRSMVTFITHWHEFPTSIVGAVDGILAVIIIIDIAHTVFDHVRSWAFSIRPFLVIGVLAGVRDILSASARLSLDSNLSGTNLIDTLIALGVAVGVVLALLFGLLILHHSGHRDRAE